MAVRQATVTVRGNVEAMGMSNFHQLVFDTVLIVNNKMAFHHFIILHVGEFTSSLNFSEIQCCIT
jgi:hypothetical protein